MFTGEEEKDRRIVDDVLCECIFFHAGLMLCHLDEASVSKALFHRMFSVLPIIFAKANQKLLYVEESCGFSSVWLEMKALSYGEALQLWQQAALDYAPRLVDSQMLREMPNKFVLTPGQIRQAAALAAQKGRAVGAEVSAKDLYEACHELLSVYMGKKVQRITPSYQWQDLVLPAFQKQMLQVACDQVRYRHQVYETWGFEHKMTYGRGISMVFSGLPGTGKTMAAQVIASELGMDLYKVELAAVVSKYIGETEKNLEEIFEQAAASQVILFFDEADVMFSKRTEVRDSNDRYSNMEAAYMLQRIESYEGIVILSTNYIQNFDEAFKRRMKMIVDFPFPDANQRYQIWKKVFPKELPLEQEVDLEYLSHQFEFSGSNIKNVALYASFLAASQKERVTMKHLIDGVKNEYAKIGKQLQPQDMGEYFMLW